MKQRKTLSEDCGENVKKAFKLVFSYNPLTGEITRKETGRTYNKVTFKGYKRDIYLKIGEIEYRSTYHRLCWFLYYDTIIPSDIQIDHINNIKLDNRIVNLRLCTNAQNSKKKPLRADNKSGYKGICYTIDRNKYGTIYHYYTAAIAIDKKSYKIGRFKDPIIAASYYDSAARYYFKDFSLCNFSDEILPPMTIEQLQIHKKNNKH